MTRLLHTALLLCSAYAAASACKDGSLEIVKGSRCRRYAECENGSWHLKECKFGQIFDSNTLSCTTVTEVGRCNDNSRCSEGRVYSYPGSTSLYYRCINGRISIQVCGTGEIFDPDLQNCRFDQGFQYTGLNRAKRDACVEGSRQRDGKSCKDYIECVNGQEVKKTCTDCMNFDDKAQRCRFVFISPCPYDPTPEPITTPGPETTTPEPETPTQEPETTTPEPETTTPEPETTKPEPETTTPEPETTTPGPETTTPESETTTPEPETTTPEPETTTPEPETTTVGPCNEGEKVGVVDPDCKAYLECKNGVWVNDACGWLRKFDANKKECEFSWFNKITCAA